MKDLLLLFDGFRVDIGTTALQALVGILFVFAGISLLIGILLLVGLIMKKLEKARREKHEKHAKAAIPAEHASPEIEEGISPEIVAAITAAVTVCMQGENAKCEFVVRRIKRI